MPAASAEQRERKRSTAKVERVVPGTRVVAFVFGRGGPNPAMVTTAFVGLALVVAFVVFAASGILLVPGGLVVLVSYGLLCPRRGIAVCDRGLAVTTGSGPDGAPRRVLALAAPDQVAFLVASGGHTQVRVGHELVWLPQAELDLFRAALAATEPVWRAGPGR